MADSIPSYFVIPGAIASALGIAGTFYAVYRHWKQRVEIQIENNEFELPALIRIKLDKAENTKMVEMQDSVKSSCLVDILSSESYVCFSILNRTNETLENCQLDVKWTQRGAQVTRNSLQNYLTGDACKFIAIGELRQNELVRVQLWGFGPFLTRYNIHRKAQLVFKNNPRQLFIFDENRLYFPTSFVWTTLFIALIISFILNIFDARIRFQLPNTAIESKQTAAPDSNQANK